MCPSMTLAPPAPPQPLLLIQHTWKTSFNCDIHGLFWVHLACLSLQGFCCSYYWWHSIKQISSIQTANWDGKERIPDAAWNCSLVTVSLSLSSPYKHWKVLLPNPPKLNCLIKNLLLGSSLPFFLTFSDSQFSIPPPNSFAIQLHVCACTRICSHRNKVNTSILFMMHIISGPPMRFPHGSKGT